MKKFITTAIAASMLMSMAVTSIAADADDLKVDATSRLFMENDRGEITEVSGDFNIEPGESLFIEVLPVVEGEDVTADAVNRHRVYLDFAEGESEIEDYDIVSKKIYAATGEYNINTGATAVHGLATSYPSLAELQGAVDAITLHTDEICVVEGCTDPAHFSPLSDAEKTTIMESYSTSTSAQYKYLVELETEAGFTISLKDLVGDVTIAKSSTASKDAPSKEIATEIGYEMVTLTDDVHDVDNDEPVVNFKNIDDYVELFFGSDVIFTVDVDNQDELYLGFTETPNFDVLAEYPDAHMDFLTFEGNPEFNRIGTMSIYEEDNELFIYEISEDGSLTEIDADYNEDYESYQFKTRTLGSYAISETELDLTEEPTVEPEVEEPTVEEPTVEEPTVAPTVKPNPETGR